MLTRIERWSSYRLAGVLAAATFLVYGNSLANRFAYDDVPIILQNPRVYHLFPLGRLVLRPYWPDYGTQLGLYRPLAILGYALQWAVAGAGAPWLFHLVNVLLHAGVVVLLFFLLRRLTGQTAAFLGALLFAVHPVHVEAVANIVGQAELAAAAAVLGACLIMMTRPEGVAVGAGRAAAIAACFAAAVGFKENAIVAPALLPLLDIAQGRLVFTRRDFGRYVRALLPLGAALVAVAAAYLALRYHVLGSLSGSDTAPAMLFIRQHHLLMGLRAWPEYVRLLFFPLDLSADYSPGVILPLTTMSPMAALGLFLFVCTLGLALFVGRRPDLGLAAAWFLVTICVTSNVFFPVGIVVAERTLYLPSVALAILVAFAARALLARPEPTPRRAQAVAFAVVILLLGVRSVIRNPVWRDTQSIGAALLRDCPESYRAQWAAASSAVERRDTVEAAYRFRLATSIWPNDAALLNDYAKFEAAGLRYDRAERMLHDGLAMHPDAGTLRATLARIYLRTGRFQEALAQAEAGLRYNDALELHYLHARALYGLERYAEAAREWTATFSQPGSGSSQDWIGLASARARSGQTRAALAAFDTARARAVARHDTLSFRQVEQVRQIMLEDAGSAAAPPVSRQP